MLLLISECFIAKETSDSKQGPYYNEEIEALKMY